MHELSLCQALIDQVTDIAREHGASRVDRIRLKVGPLSGVEPLLLQQAYPLVAAGTLAEGAELVIEPSEIRVRCNLCGAETQALPNRLLCKACGAFQTRLVSGDELLLENLELRIPD
ncbi:hydrogenase maturation nickel metallochaperone HypA [Thermochromatium tepidum]|uniref:Hydrogenase maturation factor HypA n=1 Tax=Thermochromatium tepidum ATCC 43061 TaxID=316276 RepID=A0A6I6EHA7_THETI|nr:hydrogenase maturation nickel metallochaperone HypA [Thermochromatium tepidum]QGU33610.1 hydrogenase maturation nickel metallochaperone HypA [Thermochromatium tepidum ATCC 43061]